MQIINQIDQLISKLNELKPHLADDYSSNQNKFKELLKSTIETNYIEEESSLEAKDTPESSAASAIPSWVNKDYSYNPENPRKPNMRELMEAISGKTVEELYSMGGEYCQRITRQASEMLYGVVGANKDTRDWNAIMASENILEAAQQQTRSMYEPTVDVISIFDEKNKLIEQAAVLKDKQGVTLTALPSHIASAEETLRNFGASKDSIPSDIEDQIDKTLFDKNLLGYLKNFDTEPKPIESEVLQSASKAIAEKLSQQLPTIELAKLSTGIKAT